jgi:hypothetical protein
MLWVKLTYIRSSYIDLECYPNDILKAICIQLFEYMNWFRYIFKEISWSWWNTYAYLDVWSGILKVALFINAT